MSEHAELREASEMGLTLLQLRAIRARNAATTKRVTVPRYRDPIVTGERHGDTLNLVLHLLARSKKNNQQTIYRQDKHGRTRQFRVPSEAYQTFAFDVKTSLLPLRYRLKLPLPDIPYELRAVFVMPDDQADVDNLVVGLNDALEEADVFANDRQIRRLHITHAVDVDRPRIEFALTPIDASVDL